MDTSKDQENWQKLVQQIKAVTDNNFDIKVREEVFENLSNKKLTYFLKAFASDDGTIDDGEYELLEWLMNDLYDTKTSEDNYHKRIINMMR